MISNYKNTRALRELSDYDPYQLEEGQTIYFYVNQAEREANILVRLKSGETVVEYEMPNGTTAMRRYIPGKGWRNMSYNATPKRLLLYMVAHGIKWWGVPQGSTKHALTPSELLKSKFGVSHDNQN